MARGAATRQAIGRPHPCLPTPRAERQRLLVAYHLALHDLKAGQPPTAWRDLEAAALVAQLLMDATQYTDKAVAAARRASATLAALRQGIGTAEAAIAACGRFSAVWEALLVTVPLQRLEDAKAVAAARL